MRTYWDLPGPGAWLNALGNDIRSGASVLVVSPSSRRPAGLAEILTDTAPRPADHFVVDDPAAFPCAGLPPAAASFGLGELMADTLGLSPPPGTAARDALEHAGRITVVVDARGCDVDTQAAWAHQAAWLAERTRAEPASTRPVVVVLLCPLAGAMPPIPRTDVSLRVRWFWGALGPVDTALWAAELGLDPEIAACADDVARWDLDLLGDLTHWDGQLPSLSDIVGIAARVDCVPPEPDDAPATPPHDHLAGWAAGLVEAWDGVLAQHVRLEAARSPLALHRRAWAGQLARVLPMIELEGRRLAEWFDSWVGAADVLDEWAGRIVATDIGELHRCLGDHWHQAQIWCPYTRRKLIEDLRDARNELAHGRTIPPALAAQLRQQAREDRRGLFVRR